MTLALAFLAACLPVQDAPVAWKGGDGPEGSLWSVAANWSTGKVPGPTDDVVIDSPDAKIILNGFVTVHSVRLLRGSVTQGADAVLRGDLEVKPGATWKALSHRLDVAGKLESAGQLLIERRSPTGREKGSFFVDLTFGIERVEVRARLDEAGPLTTTPTNEIEALGFLTMDFTQYLNLAETPDRDTDDVRLGVHLRMTTLALEGDGDQEEQDLDAVDVVNSRHTFRFHVDLYQPVQSWLWPRKESVVFDGMNFGIVALAGFSTDKDLDVAHFYFAGLRIARTHLTHLDFLLGTHEDLDAPRFLIHGQIVLLEVGSTNFLFGGAGLFGEGEDDVSIFFGATIGARDLLAGLPVIGPLLGD